MQRGLHWLRHVHHMADVGRILKDLLFDKPPPLLQRRRQVGHEGAWHQHWRVGRARQWREPWRQKLNSALKREETKRQQAADERRTWHKSRQATTRPDTAYTTSVATAKQTVILKWAITLCKLQSKQTVTLKWAITLCKLQSQQTVTLKWAITLCKLQSQQTVTLKLAITVTTGAAQPTKTSISVANPWYSEADGSQQYDVYACTHLQTHRRAAVWNRELLVSTSQHCSVSYLRMRKRNIITRQHVLDSRICLIFFFLTFFYYYFL